MACSRVGIHLCRGNDLVSRNSARVSAHGRPANEARLAAAGSLERRCRRLSNSSSHPEPRRRTVEVCLKCFITERMIQVQLEELGWNGFFASQGHAGVPGRVAWASRERFLVWTENGEAEAGVVGRMRHSGSAWPAVGDWVALRPDSPVIEGVFERKTVLSRKQPGRAMDEQVLAANIDVLFLVSGLDSDYSQRRIERYLVLARQSGARPIILLNKSDLAESYGLDLGEVVAALRRRSGAPVLPLSAVSRQGLSDIGALMAAGETAALIGSSGVGKSTIVNGLLDEGRQTTREVRPGDDRGRHTTTTRSLFRMPGGWLLIDMPGLREVQLWASVEQLDASFDDVRELAQGCRFRNCAHQGEPGCAVLEAGIDAGRLDNFQKMRRELEYLERKTDKRSMSETRARWKTIHKAMRRNPKPG
jgi:ribosome biogenesis GTPase